MKAFPGNHMVDWNDTQIEVSEPGMNLRDYFAAAALTGLIATNSLPPDLMVEGVITHTRLAEDAYRCAAAMMKEREK